MKKEKVLTLLQELGLSEKEAAIYLAALSLGPCSVLQLSRTSDIKRTTIYPLIDSLTHKGLVVREMRGWKEYMVASDPVMLQQLLEQRKHDLNALLPELSALHNSERIGDVVRQYEGLTGIKSIYEDVLASIHPQDEYCVISNMATWLSLDESFFRDFQERRGEYARIHRVSIRLLLQDNEEARWMKKHEKNFCVQVKFLPKEVVLKTNTIIVPSFLVIHQMEPRLIAFTLTTKNIIRAQKAMFDILWNALP